MAKFATMMEKIRGCIRDYLSRTLAVFVLFGLFLIALGGVSQNDRWKITNVAVMGANVVGGDTIIAAVHEELSGNYYFIYSRNNSYLFPAREIEATLMQMFPRLASVHAQRVDDHTIAIEVTEREPVALWCGEAYIREMYELNGCWFVDETGFIFDHAPLFSEGVYSEMYGALEHEGGVEILRAHLPVSRFVLAQAFRQRMDTELGSVLRTVFNSNGEYEITVRSSARYSMLNKIEVRFKDGQDPDLLIRNLVAALAVQFPQNGPPQKKLLYIDLRFGNKVFFGFEN